MNFMGSKTLPSACYILFPEFNIPFHSTINGYKNNFLWPSPDTYLLNSIGEKNCKAIQKCNPKNVFGL